MERGELSPTLARIQKTLSGATGVKTNEMRVRYGIHASLIKIKEAKQKSTLVCAPNSGDTVSQQNA
jgi:hypothetical protein